jgi:hypothetical protein
MRLFSICPRVRKHSSRIVATTAWRVRLLFLGTIYRKVVIDPTNKTVSIFSRYLWLIRRRSAVPFSKVKAVTYGYEDMSLDSLVSYAHDSYDWFTVGLRFKDDSEIRLFNFIGDGTFSNNGPFPDWVYWDEYAFDISGSQDKESRVFVDVLSKIIGVKVIPPRNC